MYIPRTIIVKIIKNIAGMIKYGLTIDINITTPNSVEINCNNNDYYYKYILLPI